MNKDNQNRRVEHHAAIYLTTSSWSKMACTHQPDKLRQHETFGTQQMQFCLVRDADALLTCNPTAHHYWLWSKISKADASRSGPSSHRRWMPSEGYRKSNSMTWSLYSLHLLITTAHCLPAWHARCQWPHALRPISDCNRWLHMHWSDTNECSASMTCHAAQESAV